MIWGKEGGMREKHKKNKISDHNININYEMICEYIYIYSN